MILRVMTCLTSPELWTESSGVKTEEDQGMHSTAAVPIYNVLVMSEALLPAPARKTSPPALEISSRPLLGRMQT